MSRLIFFGDLAATGFGTVTMDLGRELLKLGHDVRFVSQNDLAGDLPEPFASRTFQVNAAVLDADRSVVYGDNSLALTAHGVAGLFNGRVWADDWQPEAALILGDFVGIRLVVMGDPLTRAAFASVPSWHYVPIEGVDLPPAWAETWKVLRPLAMSEFGADQIAAIMGGVRPPVLYHGVDTETFHPVSPERPIRIETPSRTYVLRDKWACKRFFNGKLPVKPNGDIWLLRADRLMPRKRYPSMLRAVAPIMAKRANVWMMMHCRTVDQGGVLDDTLSKYPPSIRSRMVPTRLLERYGSVPRDVMAALYNAADIYVSTSAEGFGLTIAEAMACGAPVVAMDYSAVPEVVGDGGLLAPAAFPIDNEYDHVWAAVNEPKFGELVAKLCDDAPLRHAIGRQATKHINTFRWDRSALTFSAIMREALGSRDAPVVAAPALIEAVA